MGNLTAHEIEEIIAIVASVVGTAAPLVQKLIAMKGKSDSDLLTEAGTADAATRAQIDADSGTTSGS